MRWINSVNSTSNTLASGGRFTSVTVIATFMSFFSSETDGGD
jgi:hypothetical protein